MAPTSTQQTTIDSDESPPLVRAVLRGQDLVVGILLRAGANTQWTNKNGSTAATTACAKGHFAVVELLINHDSDLLDKPDGDGCVVTFASGKHVWAHCNMSFLVKSWM